MHTHLADKSSRIPSNDNSLILSCLAIYSLIATVSVPVHQKKNLCQPNPHPPKSKTFSTRVVHSFMHTHLADKSSRIPSNDNSLILSCLAIYSLIATVSVPVHQKKNLCQPNPHPPKSKTFSTRVVHSFMHTHLADKSSRIPSNDNSLILSCLAIYSLIATVSVPVHQKKNLCQPNPHPPK